MAAEFTINGTAFDTLEYEAEHDEVLTFALEEAPGFDASSVTYSVVLGSHGAPALAFSPSSGSPTTPTGEVTATAPSSGTHSYRVQCQVNNGYDGSGRWNSAYTRERIVSIRSANLGMRKLVPGETTQAHASGWTVAQNEMVDAVDDLSGGGGASGVVDPTPDTVAQRGPDGELKATRIELASARFLPGAPTQVGDVGFSSSSERIQAWRPNLGARDVLLKGDLYYVAHWEQPAVSAGTYVERVIGATWPQTMRIAEISFFPHGNLSGFDSTNYASLTIRSVGGVSITNHIAWGTTLGEPEWVAYNRMLIDVDIDAQEDGSALFGIVEHTGSGRALPAFSVFVKLVAYQ